MVNGNQYNPKRLPLRMTCISFLAGVLVCLWFAQFDSPTHHSPVVKAASIPFVLQGFAEHQCDDFEFDSWVTNSSFSFTLKPASLYPGDPATSFDSSLDGQTLVGLRIRLQI